MAVTGRGRQEVPGPGAEEVEEVEDGPDGAEVTAPGAFDEERGQQDHGQEDEEEIGTHQVEEGAVDLVVEHPGVKGC